VASTFVPGAPNELLACRYHGFNQAQPIGSLASSSLLPANSIARELNDAQPVPSYPHGCTLDSGDEVLLIFGYRDGSHLEADVSTSGCAYASNGSRSVEVPGAVLDTLQARLGKDTVPGR
jgi:hypothetical protein